MKKLPIEPPAAIWIGRSTRNTTNNPLVVLQYPLLVVNRAVFSKCSLALKKYVDSKKICLVRLNLDIASEMTVLTRTLDICYHQHEERTDLPSFSPY